MAASYTLWPVPQQYIFTNLGAIASGAKASFYAAGTTTAAAVYTDSTGATALSQPVVATAGGRFPAIYLTAGLSYKVVVTDSAGAAIYTQDNISAVPTSSNNVDLANQTAGQALLASQVVYQSDGSGSKTAGQWYLSDATNPYSSTDNLIGVTTAAIASGAQGSIRITGNIGGFSTLIAGTRYYVDSATPGGVVSTVPNNNKRFVGQADTTSSLNLTLDPPQPIVTNAICQGRLTLTSGTPVTTTDVTGATSIYFTPYLGNRMALYDGSSWNIRAFSEITIALGTLTSGLPYDLFCYDSAGVVTFDAPLAWTNGTTRATALVLQDGILSKSGDTKRRYIGSFYTTATTTTEDSAVKRFVWNYYNRMPRYFSRNDTGTWAYQTLTWRQANANTANQVAVMIGYQESPVHLTVQGIAGTANGSGDSIHVGIGVDSITAPTGNAQAVNTLSVNGNVYIPVGPGVYDGFPGLGYHYMAWLEEADITGTVTWQTAYGSGLYGYTIQ